MESYFMLLFWLCPLSVPYFDPNIKGLSAMQKFKYSSIRQPRVQIPKRVLKIPGFVQLIPYPRLLHIGLILVNTSRVLVLLLGLGQFLVDCLAGFDSRFDSVVGTFYF